MSISIKTCSACGQINPAFHAFCPVCGATLVESISRSAPWTVSSGFPPLAAAVDPEKKRRRRQPIPDGPGAGFIWIGFFIAALPVAVGTGTVLAYSAWTAGILIVITGYWLLRRDPHALSRAGLATNGIALLSLAIIGVQLISTEREQRNPRSLAVLSPSPTPTPTAIPDWAVPTAVSTPAAEVAMYRGDAAHTGVNPGPGIMGRPMRGWRFDTAGELYASPAVANGLVYIATKSGFVFALDLLTAEVKWRADLGDGIIIKAAPAAVDDRVIVAAGPNLVALDPMTGELLWQTPTPPLSESSPTVDNGRIFVASSSSAVYAFDEASGEQLWSYQADGLVQSSPAVAGDVLFVGSDNGKLYALSVKTGQPQWQFETEGGIFSSQAVAGGKVFATSIGGKVYALAVAGNSKKSAVWQYDAGGEASPIVANGMVYVAGADGGLYAFDAAGGGAPAWLFPTGSSIVTSPVYADGVVYVASGQTLYAIDAATGTERWQFGAGYAINTSPVVIGGVILIGGEDGYLDAVTGDGSA